MSSQAAPDLLAALRQIAESRGRQFQAVLDEALSDYIDRHQNERPLSPRDGCFRAFQAQFNNGCRASILGALRVKTMV